MQVTRPLSDGERLEFEQCRETIRANIKTCFEVGKALARIRDGELYREHWNNFDAFCKAEFSIGKSHAYRLIDAAGVKASVQSSPIGDTVQNEAQARALKDVPEEKRAEVMEAAAKATDGNVTAAAIKTAAAKIAPPEPPKPIIELDATGFAIPEKLVEFWERRGEVQKLLTAVSLLRSTLRRAQEEDDPLYRPVCHQSREQTWTALLTALDRAYANIGLAMPYAVCPVCQGRLMSTCTTCQQRGFVSEFFYKHQYDSDSRRVREASCQRKEK